MNDMTGRVGETPISEADELCLPARYRKLRFNSVEASDYLEAAHGVSIAKATLDKKRVEGGGPVFQKFGRAVFYQRSALDEWALERLGTPRASTSGQ